MEGGSTDHTRATIEKEIARHPDREIRLVAQSGTGKWNAVQEGFAASKHEVLMILDGDLTVPPEDLPKFYAALVSGRGELINGNRLVYGMEPGAMRSEHGREQVFAGLLSWVLGQYVKDTLCGTKVLHRDDYARISRRRSEFGREDPFGDFDLLLGASLLGLEIVNVPVRYAARRYGRTNIQRFRSGATLLRLAMGGYRRMWVTPVGAPRSRPELGAGLRIAEPADQGGLVTQLPRQGEEPPAGPPVGGGAGRAEHVQGPAVPQPPGKDTPGRRGGRSLEVKGQVGDLDVSCERPTTR